MLLSVIGGLILAFGFVVFVGAPYLPTTKKQIDVALDLLDLSPGKSVLELGAGDGRVALAAARRGLNVVAVELNPLLCLVIFIRTWRYRRQVRVVCSNFWHMEWPEVEGVFVFLLDRYMERLNKKLIQKQNEWKKEVRLASFAFKIPRRKCDDEKAGVFLYVYKNGE